MDRREFVETLRSLLQEELPADKVEENIRYYDDYIRSCGDTESQVKEIERIGHPNIIAQTIIDSYKMSDGYKYKQPGGDYYYERNQDLDEQEAEQSSESSLFSKIKHYTITVVAILAILLLIRFAFVIFIRVGIPLIAIYAIVRLIKGSTRR